MADDEHAKHDGSRETHRYVTAKEGNGCHVNTESDRMTNYCTRQQASDIEAYAYTPCRLQGPDQIVPSYLTVCVRQLGKVSTIRWEHGFDENK